MLRTLCIFAVLMLPEPLAAWELHADAGADLMNDAGAPVLVATAHKGWQAHEIGAITGSLQRTAWAAPGLAWSVRDSTTGHRLIVTGGVGVFSDTGLIMATREGVVVSIRADAPHWPARVAFRHISNCSRLCGRGSATQPNAGWNILTLGIKF